MRLKSPPPLCSHNNVDNHERRCLAFKRHSTTAACCCSLGVNDSQHQQLSGKVAQKVIVSDFRRLISTPAMSFDAFNHVPVCHFIGFLLVFVAHSVVGSYELSIFQSVSASIHAQEENWKSFHVCETFFTESHIIFQRSNHFAQISWRLARLTEKKTRRKCGKTTTSER